MKNKQIILTHIDTHKDGGFKSFRDKNNNEYWQDFRLGTNTKGILFVGNINCKSPEKAIGNFKLIERKRVRVQYKILRLINKK